MFQSFSVTKKCKIKAAYRCVTAISVTVNSRNCIHLEAAVSEAAAVVVFVPAEENVGQARLAHPRRPQDDDPRTVIPENE